MKHFTKFEYKKIKLHKPKRKSRNKQPTYEPCFADTETSHTTFIDEDGVEQVGETWIYLWAISVGVEIYYGRSVLEFIQFTQKLLEEYPDGKLVIYFHNMGYDISYMWDLLFKELGTFKLFALSNNHPFLIQFEDINLEIRCSYRMVNKSLAKWGNDLNIEHKKKEGLIEYSIIYKPQDELPEDEYTYLEYDILSLKECWYKECYINKDDILTVPYTSTGYVRRMFKKAYWSNMRNRKILNNCKPTIDQYVMQLEASQGGKTLGNIEYVGETITGDIGHGDYDSFYPTSQLLYNFPMKPMRIYEYDPEKPFNIRRLKWYLSHGYYFIARVQMSDVLLNEGCTCPFLSASKCKFLMGSDKLVYNNNILKADLIETVITNYDYDVLQQQYQFNIAWLEIDVYTTAPLPDYVRDTIWQLYQEKTYKKDNLQEVDKEYGVTSLEHHESHAILMNTKSRLNSIFGCTYTKIIREEISINNNLEWVVSNADYTQDNLDESWKRTVLSYAWGLFTTSICRWELHQLIKDVIGYENYLYMDTDSCFYIKTEENQKRLKEHNARIQKEAKEKGLYFIRKNGKEKIMHLFDSEDDLKQFRYLHAKCYAMTTLNDELIATIAGVPQFSDASKTFTREQELGSIENLKKGFIFEKCGGTRSVYNCHEYSYNKEMELYTCGGCTILSTTKKLNDIDSYIYEGEWRVKEYEY